MFSINLLPVTSPFMAFDPDRITAPASFVAEFFLNVLSVIIALAPFMLIAPPLFVAMLLSYIIGQKRNAIGYDMKSIIKYIVLFAAVYGISTVNPIENSIAKMACNTVLLVVFVAYFIKKDLPLKSLHNGAVTAEGDDDDVGCFLTAGTQIVELMGTVEGGLAAF